MLFYTYNSFQVIFNDVSSGLSKVEQYAVQNVSIWDHKKFLRDII